MATLFLDTETFSTVPITHGTHAYAEGAEIMLVPWAWDDEPVYVWDTQDIPNWRDDLQAMIDKADEVVLHNSHFDRTVLRHCGVKIPVDKITDTMVIAMQHSLPGSLAMLCDVLGVPQDKAKDKAGKKLIQLLTKPRPKNVKLRRATRETHPDEWNAFIEYARLDVDAMRELYRRLPHWNRSSRERDLWIADQRINDRGVAVDRELATAALRAFQRTSRSLAARTAAITGGVVASLTQRQKLMDYLAVHHNFAPEDMTKGTVAGLLKGDLDPVVRELLEIRQQASATSPAKYKVILNAASSDGRLRGTIQFCGASRTGRDAGRIFQPQNLPRPALKPDVIEHGIEAMKLDCEDLLFDNVSELCSSAVRGCLVAEPGNKLVVADLSNIEGRVLAWLAGEDWKVKAFYDFDRGVGHDLYKLTAGRILGKEPGDITKDERQVSGKVPELACGYQGGVGAFAAMGAIYGVNMPEEEAQGIVNAWRKQHPMTVRFWYDVERAAIKALKNPGEVFEVRALRIGVKQWLGMDWLCIKLPSGRYLCYPNAHLDWKREMANGIEMRGPIGYDGVDQFTKQWLSLGTYGGKLVENIVQAVARDIFMGGMLRADAEGYPVCVRVHDELICETPDDPAFTVKALSAHMTRGESWSTGLPLAAAGHEMYRYAKLD
jgi:DNA polymerase